MTSASTVDESEVELPERRSNRPVTLLHRLEFGLALILFGFFKVIGLDASSALAGGFTRIVGPLIRPVSKRAEDNLALIFPDWSRKQIKRTTAKVWENLGRTAAEFAHLEKFRPLEKDGRVSVEGAERLQEATARGPVITVSGHFANWEIMPVSLHRLGLDYAFVYRAANNPLIDELIIKKRGRVMSRHQMPKEKNKSRAMVEHLKAGRSLALLVDQKLNDGVTVPFMGKEAMSPPAAAKLSLKFHAPVMPVSLARLDGAHFHMTIHEPIAFAPTGDTEADARALTAKINQAIEQDIRARPGQWLWLHRRWTKKKK